VIWVIELQYLIQFPVLKEVNVSIKREKVKVYDMTCTSCEGKVERTLKKLEGVASVKASFSAQQVIVEYDSKFCDISMIKASIKSAGYSIESSNSFKIIGIFIVAAAIILLGSSTGGFDMNEKLNGASYFVLFVVGMLTSIHCVGMCGGIMLSQSISKDNTSKFEAIRPAILYNAGRIVAYTVIGGIVGALGSVLALSLAVKAALQIFAGIFMIIMGLNMAGFGMFRKINIRLPWSACSVKNKPKTPFLVGLLNGLMPCGPLQTMQLYALGTGSAAKGALSMLLFSLGTVPLMLTFGALSGLLSKGYTKKILKMSGFLVIILGFIMGSRGLALAGVGVPNIIQLGRNQISNSSSKADISKSVLKDGIQELIMTVDGSGFTPNILYVKKNVPVKWIVKGDAINPCNNAIAIPSLNKQYTVKSGENVIEFTPGDKDINFSCWMGMIRGTIKVTDNLNTVDTSESASSPEVEKAPSIFGDDLNLVPTDRIVKKSAVEDKIQTIKIRAIGYEFEPLIVIANKGMNTKLSLDLRAFDTPDEKFNIVDSDTKETIASVDGKKDIVVKEVKFDKAGTFVVANEKNVLTVILVVNDIKTVDLEEVRAKYLSTK
jgi:sulfite exporter TauE/SafE/plastocyanin domain-containing protein/copper chaperone CopZ